jgi:hypothetical protein
VWLLKQVAIATNIRQDLEVVFKGNMELVDDIMTLAIFPYITGLNTAESCIGKEYLRHHHQET